MSTVPRHPFSTLFQLRTGHGVLEKCFQTRYISEKSHYYKCGQLGTVRQAFKEGLLYLSEKDFLKKKSFPKLDPKILLGTKKGLGAVVKFLDSLPQHLG